jgi:hypothetical protein
MTKLRTLGFSSALVAAALIGGTVMSAALAGSPAPAAPDVVDPARVTGEPSEYCTTFRTAFAANLGVSEDKMVAAAKAAIGTTVDKAVADGKLTAAAGERIKERVAKADADGCRILGGWRAAVGRAVVGVARDGLIAAADALDMTPGELRAQLRTGATLKEVAAAEGVPYETVTSAVMAAVKADLDAAVANGRITQARADRILERLEARLAAGGFQRQP